MTDRLAEIKAFVDRNPPHAGIMRELLAEVERLRQLCESYRLSRADMDARHAELTTEIAALLARVEQAEEDATMQKALAVSAVEDHERLRFDLAAMTIERDTLRTAIEKDAPVREALKAEVERLREHHAFIVTDPVGGNVSAPCAIEGCRYTWWEQRHAAEVEAAFREGYDAGNLAACKATAGYTYADHRAAWLASEARRRLTGQESSDAMR